MYMYSVSTKPTLTVQLHLIKNVWEGLPTNVGEEILIEFNCGAFGGIVTQCNCGE